MIEAADGVGLRFAFWPASGETRGAILLAQGRTEYIEKSYEWIEQFRARGLDVAAFDFRGQGLSQRLLPNRRRGYIESFDLFQRDYDAAFDALKVHSGASHFFVSGHSMGGLATVRFLSRRQDELGGAFLSAPMLGLALSPMLSLLARNVSRGATRLGFGTRYLQGCDDRSGPERGFEDNVLTHDAERFARHEEMLAQYPDLALGGTTHAWLNAGYREMAAVAALPEGWVKVPVLLASAGKDTVVSNAAIARFVARNPLVSRIHLPDSRHEPLMETDAVQALLWPAIDGFFDRVLTPPSVSG